VGRLDHGAAADVHRHVVAAAWPIEEEVTGLEVGHADRGGRPHLRARGAGETDPGLAPGPLDQSRAIEFTVRVGGGSPWVLAAEHVLHPELALRRCNCTGTTGGDRWGGKRSRSGSRSTTTTTTATISAATISAPATRRCCRCLRCSHSGRCGLRHLGRLGGLLLGHQRGHFTVLLGQGVGLLLDQLGVLVDSRLLGGDRILGLALLGVQLRFLSRQFVLGGMEDGHGLIDVARRDVVVLVGGAQRLLIVGKDRVFARRRPVGNVVGDGGLLQGRLVLVDLTRFDRDGRLCGDDGGIDLGQLFPGGVVLLAQG
jgi:hypothetical protein